MQQLYMISHKFSFDSSKYKNSEARVVTGWLADLVIGLYSEREDCRGNPEFKEMVKCLQHA